MSLVPAVCPSCGASIQLPEGEDKAFCSFCGNQFLTEAAIAFAKVKVKVEGVVQTKTTDFIIEGGVLKGYHGEATDIVIPDNVFVIGYSAFSDMHIQSVVFPRSLEEIEDYAFSGCSALTSIDLSQTCLKKIGLAVFSDCISIERVTFPSSLRMEDVFSSGGEFLFQRCSGLTSVDLSDTAVMVIPIYCFDGCSSLVDIKLPNHLLSIHSEAFRDCSSLSSIDIPASVSGIGKRAFFGCEKLTTVVWHPLEGETLSDCIRRVLGREICDRKVFNSGPYYMEMLENQ